MTTYELYITDERSTKILHDGPESDFNYFQTSSFTAMLNWVCIILDALKGTDTHVGVMVDLDRSSCNENM